VKGWRKNGRTTSGEGAQGRRGSQINRGARAKRIQEKNANGRGENSKNNLWEELGSGVSRIAKGFIHPGREAGQRSLRGAQAMGMISL